MRDSTFLEDEIRREDLAACTRVLACPSNNFNTLVAAAGINPHTDFINSDLTGCDLSDCDLRGYNFAGADLSGVVVSGATWDRTTNFEGADISGTPFAFSQAQKEFFEGNPHYERMVRSLTSSDWMGVEIWLGKDRTDAETRAAARIAFEVYEKTDKPYIKTIILYYSLYQFESQEAYRGFLLSELARANPPGVIASCLNIVGRIFAEDREAQAGCQPLLAHQSAFVRNAALAALLNGIRGVEMPSHVHDYILAESDGYIRRYYLGRLARRFSPIHVAASTDERSESLHRDFRDPVTHADIHEIADRPSVRSAILAREPSLPTPPISKPHEKAQQKKSGDEKRAAQFARRQVVRQVFEDFITVGVPFQIE